jgi:hypothetical protein
MKKQAIAAAVSVALGVSTLSAQANTAGLTGVWSGTYTFTMYSPGNGFIGDSGAPQAWTWNFDAGTVSINNTTAFFGNVWTAHDVTFSDTGTSYGPPSAGAVNMLFDWSVNPNIPVSSDWDVTATGNAFGDTAAVAVNSSVITANSTAFPDYQPAFTGSLTKSPSAVPVPAAAWLLGSGLVGLVGVARRRRRR